MIDGPLLLRLALDAGVVVEEVFASDGVDTELLAAATAAGAQFHPVRSDVLARAVDTVTPQGVAAVARRVEVPVDAALAACERGPLALVLVDVADPGNAGTLLRAAEAAGAAAVLFCGDSVDPSNAKFVRASAGALFHVPVAVGGEALGVLERLGERGVHTVATVPEGGRAYDAADLTGPVAVVLGSEAHGLAADVLARVDEQSLNVAMAGSILCFEALRQRRASGP
ncbi:MAG: RNA methyltransferase [Acidimicrobiales bacterium]